MTGSDTFAIPDTNVSSAALELASAYHSAALLNHSRRVYVWAAGYGTRHDIPYDAELLFVAAMFHDLGLAPEFDSHTIPFEEAGGHVAQVFAAGAGWPGERRGLLGRTIVRHMWPDVDVADDPHGHLLCRATALDIAGRNIDDFDPGFRAEVLRQYPRLGLADEFLACFRAQADRKTGSAADRTLRSGLAVRMATNPLETDSGNPPDEN